MTTTEEIKAETDIPVVYLTAHGDEKTPARAKISGPSEYVTKPAEEKQMHAAVELALKITVRLKIRTSIHN